MTTPELPAPYPGHRHATAEYRSIAQDGLQLIAEVGSGVHGTSLPGTDDTDWMGVCVEPPAYVTGLRRFEQFERHTAWDRAGGVRERSGGGDLDVVIYGLRKFCRLALDGNPSILTMLFVPNRSIVHETWLGRELLDRRRLFVSLRAADRYLGYLHAQRRGMNGQGRVNRPELIALHGYDTKFAGHAIRLGVQGIELMENGEIHLPMDTFWRAAILAIRRGEVAADDAQGLIDALERKLRRLRDTNPHGRPEQPDRVAIDRWLHRAYRMAWSDRARAAGSVSDVTPPTRGAAE